jgi:hypothetical protein
MTIPRQWVYSDITGSYCWRYDILDNGIPVTISIEYLYKKIMKISIYCSTLLQGILICSICFAYNWSTFIYFMYTSWDDNRLMKKICTSTQILYKSLSNNFLFSSLELKFGAKIWILQRAWYTVHEKSGQFLQ